MYASNLLMVTLVKFCSPLDFAVQSDSHHCMELILNASPTRSTQPYAQSADFQAWSSASTGCTEASPSEWSIAMTNHSGELPLPTDASPRTSLMSSSGDCRVEATRRHDAIMGFQQALDQGAVCDVHEALVSSLSTSSDFSVLHRSSLNGHYSGRASMINSKQHGARSPELPSSHTSGRSTTSLYQESSFNYHLAPPVYSLLHKETVPPQSGSSLASTSCFPPSMHHNIGALYSPSGHALSSPNMLGRASGSGLPVTQQIR
jgi:hypothetical protein